MITEEQKKKWLSGELSFEEKEEIVHSVSIVVSVKRIRSG